MRYHTFDLTVAATDSPHEYHLFAHSSTQGEASGRTKIDIATAPLANLPEQLDIRHLSPAESPAHREDGNFPPKDLQAFGITLYQCLFVGEISLLFNRALGETIGNDELGLRLRLHINPPELATLPWEFLYSPERHLFLAASVETPLSRYLNLPEPVPKLACPQKIRLLAVIPQHSGLDTTAERLSLEEISAKLEGKIAVDFLEGEATSAAIRAALRKKAYHIFH